MGCDDYSCVSQNDLLSTIPQIVSHPEGPQGVGVFGIKAVQLKDGSHSRGLSAGFDDEGRRGFALCDTHGGTTSKGKREQLHHFWKSDNWYEVQVDRSIFTSTKLVVLSTGKGNFVF